MPGGVESAGTRPGCAVLKFRVGRFLARHTPPVVTYRGANPDRRLPQSLFHQLTGAGGALARVHDSELFPCEAKRREACL